jgi:hypothetical protein
MGPGVKILTQIAVRERDKPVVSVRFRGGLYTKNAGFWASWLKNPKCLETCLARVSQTADVVSDRAF